MSVGLGADPGFFTVSLPVMLSLGLALKLCGLGLGVES